jgi:hypothetical protein
MSKKLVMTKRKTDIPQSTIAGRSQNYATAFRYAENDFWDRVQALRNIRRAVLEERKEAHVNNVFKALKWKSQFPTTLSLGFVDAFIEAVRDKKFPKKRKTQARFLGESLAADGTVSARRSRDICGESRRRSKQTPKVAEFYIYCCGERRLTVGQECPKCLRSPFQKSKQPS